MASLRSVYKSYLRTKSLIKQRLGLRPALIQAAPSPVFGEPDHYCLEQGAALQLWDRRGHSREPYWDYTAHCTDKRIGLALGMAEMACLPILTLKLDSQVFIRYAATAPVIAAGGLICELRFRSAANSPTSVAGSTFSKATATGITAPESSIAESAAGDSIVIAHLVLQGGAQSGLWRCAQIDISFLAGRRGQIQLRCCAPSPGAEDAPTADTSRDCLAIADLCIAEADQLSKIKARAFYALRSANEIAHFSDIYRHSAYAKIQDSQRQLAGGSARNIRTLTPLSRVPGEEDAYDLELSPNPQDSLFTYAARLLEQNLPSGKPDFFQRLLARARGGKPVRVLSLCAGAARIEAAYATQAAQASAQVEWSLLDINRDLLTMASQQFPPEIKLDLIAANINDLHESGEQWDIIMCISALHHVVELERVLQFCHQSLTADGEFWSLGESIGRNGNRLWPEARARANAVFQNLPETYRINAHSLQIDAQLPDNDYSVRCFEGIRSEEIEPILALWFQEVEVFRANCFLWRLVNLAYGDNYNLARASDIKIVKSLVAAELDYCAQGGKGTELFGIYKPRPLLNSSNLG